MSGQPGRSGKANTPEQRQAKRNAARMGGMAKASRGSGRAESTQAIDDGSTPSHPDALIAAFPELTHYPFPVINSIDLKDALECVNKQWKAQQSEVELEEAKAKRDMARGDALTKTRHLELVRDILDRVLANIFIITDAAISQHAPERQPIVRHELTKAEARFREAAMGAIKGT